MILNKIKVEDLSTVKVSVKETLRVGPAIVTFTKKDGSERVMKCTLDPSLLPEVIRVEKLDEAGVVIEKTRKINDDVQNVYDLEHAAWKSFRWDSITNVDSVI